MATCGLNRTGCGTDLGTGPYIPSNPIVPVVATVNIQEVIAALTGKIDLGTLAVSLKTQIEQATYTYANLNAEINNRIAANTEFSRLVTEVQTGLRSSFTLINTEITQRTDGNSLIASEISAVAVGNKDNTAAITNEKLVRIEEDKSLGVRIDANFVRNTDSISLIQKEQLTLAAKDVTLASEIDKVAVANTSAIQAAVTNISSAKIGYSALKGTYTPYDGNGTTVIYSDTTYPSDKYPEYSINRYRVIDKLGVTLWNATSAGQTKLLDWLVGLPLSTAVKKVGVSGPDGTASLEQAFIAQGTLNDGFKALYTVKLNVTSDGKQVVGGFGLYGGTTIEAGFDVDTFWVGRSSTSGTNVITKPFIIDNNIVYINNAMIHNLTASQIDTRGLTIKNEAGQIIFGAGTLLPMDNIVGGAALKVAADKAVIDSKAALDLLTDIASDAKLTSSEKQKILTEWLIVRAEYGSVSTTPMTGIVGTSQKYPATLTLQATYTSALISLGNYLNGNINVVFITNTGAIPSWIDTTNINTSTDINATAFNSVWQNLYAARQALLNSIAIEAGKTATWAGIPTGNGKPADYATVGADWNTNVSNRPTIPAAVNISGLMEKASTSILGINTTDTVRMSGIRVGDLVWNSDGVRTSGKGLALTPKGLLGHNGTSITFTIDATTGDATFGGTLSANIVKSNSIESLAITTSKIANNAVSTLNSASGTGGCSTTLVVPANQTMRIVAIGVFAGYSSGSGSVITARPTVTINGSAYSVNLYGTFTSDGNNFTYVLSGTTVANYVDCTAGTADTTITISISYTYNSAGNNKIIAFGTLK